METNGSIFFHFQWCQGCAWASPRSLWLSGSLGHYWTLLTLTSFCPLSRRPVSAQGLAPSPGLTMLWACFSLTLPSGCTPVLSPVLPLALVCWTDLGSAWFLCLLRGSGEIHCCDLWALPHPQILWHCHSASEGMACAGSPASCFQPLMAQPCSTAHADSLYACQKSPMRNSVKPFRALEGNKGVIINLCRITSLCYAKMSSPGNRDSCMQLNWAVSSSCWKPGF